MAQFGFVGTLTGNETVVWKTEGATDAAAIMSLDLPDGHTAVCNACGASETPDHRWIESMARAPEIFVIHDCDHPGQAGATWVINPGTGRRRAGWAPAIAALAPGQVRNVVLPFPLEANHGRDVRDWIIERLDAGKAKADIYAELLALARKSDPIEKTPEATIESIESEPDESEDNSQEEVLQEKSERPQILEEEDDPHRLARVVLSIFGYSETADKPTENLTIRWYRGEWWIFDGSCFRPIKKEDVDPIVSRAIRAEFESLWIEQEERRLAKENATGEEQKRHKIRKVTPQLKKSVIEAMAELAYLPTENEMPFWIGDDSPYDDTQKLIVTKTQILDLSRIEHDDCIAPSTPRLFATNALSYSFDKDAQCPEWCRFLTDIWPDNDDNKIDDEKKTNDGKKSIECLQRWFGYCLSNANWLQKMLWIIGATRSGKGTIAKVLKATIGAENCAATKIGSLAGNFPLEHLVNKRLSIIGDARLSGRIDPTEVTETLLGISGDDPQDVERKHKSTLTSVQLPVRFMLLSNQVPKLRDASAAIATRCIFLKLTKSNDGNEDRHLADRLLAELPGILNWAIVGWYRVNRDRSIDQPDSGNDVLDAFKSSVSPISDFVNEKCIVGADLEKLKLTNRSIPQTDIFVPWQEWCRSEGCEPGSKAKFANELTAAFPTVASCRPKQDNTAASRERCFRGIALRTS